MKITKMFKNVIILNYQTFSKCRKQLESMTSAEQGNKVTMIAAINVIGNSIPPLLVFSLGKFKDHMLNGGPPNV